MKPNYRQTLEYRVNDLQEQTNVLEQVLQYVNTEHSPVIMKILQEKAAEHKHYLKLWRK